MPETETDLKASLERAVDHLMGTGRSRLTAGLLRGPFPPPIKDIEASVLPLEESGKRLFAFTAYGHDGSTEQTKRLV